MKNLLEQHKADLLQDTLGLEVLVEVVEGIGAMEQFFPAVSDMYWQLANSNARKKIVEAIGKWGTSEAARFLSQAAKCVEGGDNFLGVFGNIVRSLATCEESVALRELELLLSLPDRGRAAAVVCGISRVQGEAAEELLFRIARSCEEMPGLQAQAMRQLVVRGSERGIQMVVDLASSDFNSLPDDYRIGVQRVFPLIPAELLTPQTLLDLLASQSNQVLRTTIIRKLLEHSDFFLLFSF